ncbi:MAG: hypothetical protein ACYTBJ_05545 [Planctomycetota bacterium]|jgi:hypothetical protein
MKLKSTLTLIAAVAAVAACLWWCAYCLRRRSAAAEDEKNYVTAMSRLNETIRQALDNYYDLNTGYPQNLSELDIPFDLARARPEMLDDFLYKSGPRHYVISWNSQTPDGRPQTHTESAIKGNVIYVEYYEDDQLVTRTEYPKGLQYPGTRIVKQYQAGRPLCTTEYKNGQEVTADQP